ncbi:MAG: LruC domain-containing protein, partial [Candidatus Caldatribacteriota bacterium]
TVVNISAVAAAGYEFVNWTGDVADANSSSTTVTMNSNKTVTANFKEIDPCVDNNPPYNIDLDNKSAVVGQLYTGTVTADDDDDDTLTFAFTDSYTPPGDMSIDSVTGIITWTPTVADICFCGDLASAGRQRAELIGLCDPIQVTVSDPCESVDEEFCVSVQPAQYTLTMLVSPEGSGTTNPTVEGSPHSYSAGTVVNISATAATGYQFVGWTGDEVASSGSLSTTVTMDSNKIITANFVADVYDGGTVSIAFEDLEVAENSDYDYNDWIVDLNINTSYDGNTPNLSSITFNVLPKARGAGHDHRFHILIPADTFSEDGSYNLVITGASGSDSGTFNSGEDMDFIVIPDTRASLDGETHNHTNTKEGEGPTAATVTAELTITFDSAFYHDFSQYDPYSASSMHGEGLFFDPYLEVDIGNNNQFDSADYSIHKDNPRILTVPDSWEWPEEGIAIWNVYSSVSEGNPPLFSPAWWTVSPNNCIYGDGTVCGS